MVTAARLIGLTLLILVGYHYINAPLGFSVAGSIATVLFAGCLLALYRGYRPDAQNWLGWFAIAAGCLSLAFFPTVSCWLALPLALIVLGYRLAALPFGLPRGHGDDGGTDGVGGFDDGGGDGGV